jgi:hypothetical protein
MTTVDVPWIVSVDDHVIEPPDLWLDADVVYKLARGNAISLFDLDLPDAP